MNLNNSPYFYDKYSFTEIELETYTHNLTFNILTHQNGKKIQQALKPLIVKTTEATVEQIQKKFAENIAKELAAYTFSLFPYAPDAEIIKAIAKYIIVPYTVQDNIKNNKNAVAKYIIDNVCKLSQSIGIDKTIENNIYAVGAVWTEEIEKEGIKKGKKFNQVLMNHALRYYDVDPYRSINPIKVKCAFFKNLIHNIYVVYCRILCLLNRATMRGAYLNETFQGCVNAFDKTIDLKIIAEDLELICMFTDKYQHSSMHTIREVIKAKNFVSNKVKQLGETKNKFLGFFSK